MVILSNGPGEVATWVLPVVRELHRIRRSVKDLDLRISVVFAPCPHASGREHKWLGSISEIDRTLSADHFWRFLWAGKRGFHAFDENAISSRPVRWDWHEKGVVLFLGGDQVNTVLAGLRLRYSTAAYCNEAVRWSGIVNWIALRSENLKRGAKKWTNSRQAVVGDLLRSAIKQALSQSYSQSQQQQRHLPLGEISMGGNQEGQAEEERKTILLLPGSKHAKLLVGVPFFIAVAQQLNRMYPKKYRFVLPLAPTVTLEQLEGYCRPDTNFVVDKYNWMDNQ